MVAILCCSLGEAKIYTSGLLILWMYEMDDLRECGPSYFASNQADAGANLESDHVRRDLHDRECDGVTHCVVQLDSACLKEGIPSLTLHVRILVSFDIQFLFHSANVFNSKLIGFLLLVKMGCSYTHL